MERGHTLACCKHPAWECHKYTADKVAKAQKLGLQVEPPMNVPEPKIPVDARRCERSQGVGQTRGDSSNTEVLPTGVDAAGTVEAMAADATLQAPRGDPMAALDQLNTQLDAQEEAESVALDGAEPLAGQKSEDEEIIVTDE